MDSARRGVLTVPAVLRVWLSVFLAVVAAPVAANEFQIVGPPGSSNAFGTYVTALPNGNIVIQDPDGAGAVYLYGPTGTLISTLTGSSEFDQVGIIPVIVLPNGNFLVVSYYWSNAGALVAGAVTWIDANIGLDGQVSAANSLVGSHDGDLIGGNGIRILANGNYVVMSYDWSNGSEDGAGAATWGNANTGISGVVSAANSLIGTTAWDSVGGDVVALTNGNYLVVSSGWSSPDTAGVGAVTWANGSTGIVGPVSTDNSLVGSSPSDWIGYGDAYNSVRALADGNAVVISPMWDNGAIVDAGAVTWINGSTGLTGRVSASNSWVGSSAGDEIGNVALFVGGFTSLGGGRFSILSPNWSDGSTAHVGALTWGDSATGTSGAISAANSLIGSTTGDFIDTSVTLLTKGNYVVGSPHWTRGDVASAGAVTWIDASAPRVGAVSPANSLVGAATNDSVGRSVVALANGNYVVASPLWRNGGLINAGAATWGSGNAPLVGEVTAANSLVGGSTDDHVGAGVVGNDGLNSGVAALDNGNYIVLSPYWHNGAAEGAGAATWGSGTSGITGVVSESNSLVGTTAGDYVGSTGIPLAHGNAVVATNGWNQVGAVTWIDGANGLTGAVSSVNSLVGRSPLEAFIFVTALDNGNYVVADAQWANGSATAAGATVWGDGRTGITGQLSNAIALVGTQPLQQVGIHVSAVANGNYLVASGSSLTLGRGTSPLIGDVNAENSAMSPGPYPPASYVYDAARDRVIVGWDGYPVVTVFQLDLLFAGSFD